MRHLIIHCDVRRIINTMSLWCEGRTHSRLMIARCFDRAGVDVELDVVEMVAGGECCCYLDWGLLR